MFPGVQASDQLKNEVWASNTNNQDFFNDNLSNGDIANKKNQEAIDLAMENQMYNHSFGGN